MKLVPEQLVALRKSLKVNRILTGEYNGYFDAKRSLVVDDVSGIKYYDESTERSYGFDLHDMRVHDEIVSHSKVVSDISVDKVMIGTRCSILFDGDEEEEEITLVETIDGLNVGVEGKYVSISSPLGGALLGAKEGDELSYKVNGRTLKVKVMSIVSSLDDYMKPIRSVPENKRRCYRSYQEEKLTSDKKALERLYDLTPSQFDLLRTETYFLNPRIREDKIRLNEINKVVNNSSVYISHDYDHIDIGSLFSFKLINPSGEVIKFDNVELINFAVSDEYPTEYIEKISSLGQSLYGLRVGSTFKIKIGDVNYTGEVTDINHKYLERFKNGYMYKK